MQEGIGRGGYRVLAIVFVGLGVLGLVTSFYAFRSGDARGGFFDWVGIGLSLAALACLFGLVLLVIQRPVADARRADAVFHATPKQMEFEVPVEDDERGDETAVPVEAAAPRAMLPPNRNLGADTKGWPQRTGPSGMTRGEWMAQQRAQTPSLPSSPQVSRGPSRAPYARGPASIAAVEPEPDAPVVIARVGEASDNPEWNPKGMARGRCGGCGTLLLAPPERPVRLRCPKCSKEQLLR